MNLGRWGGVVATLVVASIVVGYLSLKRWTHLTGSTMGTTYQIHFEHSGYVGLSDLEWDIEALLQSVNQQLSTWDKDSWISEFNRSAVGEEVAVPRHAWEVLQCSLVVAEASGGAFNPASLGLFDLWGFGPRKIKVTSQPPLETIQQIQKGCNIGNLFLDEANQSLKKLSDGLQIDASALTKGYAVDQIAVILEGSGLQNFSIEIGGEIRVSGKDPNDRNWEVGLQVPADYDGPAPVVELVQQSIATSGGSQDFIRIEDTVYTHIIDPRTGYPVTADQSLFSVSVIAPHCILADALATACFVMGMEESEVFMRKFPDCEVRFILHENPTINLVRSQ